MPDLSLILLQSLWCTQGLELWTFKNKIGKKTTNSLDGCRRDKMPSKGHISSSNIYKLSYTPIIFSRKHLYFINTSKVITQVPFLVCQIICMNGNNGKASKRRWLKGQWSNIHYWMSDGTNQMCQDFLSTSSSIHIALFHCKGVGEKRYHTVLFFLFQLS